MQFIENAQTELKRIFTEEIKKTAIAFANGNGGNIYIGIDDDGMIVGIENPDALARQVSDSIRNSIKPDITLFFKVEKQIIDEKAIVVVAVEQGNPIPFYLADKGMKPAGVFVRIGSATVPATSEHIRQMVKQVDGDNFVKGRSLNQELTFERAQKVFSEKDVKFDESQKRTLGLINENNQYTNLALLLSDQCEHTTNFLCTNENIPEKLLRHEIRILQIQQNKRSNR